MPTQSAAGLWSFFLAGLATLAVILGAFGTALVLGQRRRFALQQEYTRRILAAQEEERARIARDLHDDALQRVALFRHELDGLGESLSTAGQSRESHRARSLAVELEELGMTLRGLAHRLHPSVVDQVGLARALEVLAGDFHRAGGLDVTVSVPSDELRASSEVGLTAYRIVQEALRNVSAHAGTDHAVVSLRQEDGRIIVKVSDAGRGFAPGHDEGRAGLGLIAMRERAAAHGGTVRFSSRLGEGTIVEVTLPAEGPR